MVATTNTIGYFAELQDPEENTFDGLQGDPVRKVRPGRRESWGLGRSPRRCSNPSRSKGGSDEPHKAHARVGRGRNFGSARWLERLVRAIACSGDGKRDHVFTAEGIACGTRD